MNNGFLNMESYENAERYSLPSFRKFRPEIYSGARLERILAKRRDSFKIKACMNNGE
ncbi:hypothetical protein HanRHA438_Chr17g0807661 [Helianthus annuus]|nr:hypothetical protein HanRHA438_Chr17g0807661 [Helianthus annuus]